MAKKNDASSITLEERLSILEKIVQELEGGELPLEKALEKFEEGVKLYKESKEILTNVEKKIKILSEDVERFK